MNPSVLLGKLPEFRYNVTVLAADQTTAEIISEVLRKHEECAEQYDLIAPEFAGSDAPQKLFKFCQKNLPYYIEPAGAQSTLSPGGILEIGNERGVDCKHYANFIAGVLDALNRIGYDFDFAYRFAGYKPGKKDHVFIVVTQPGGREIWVDPTPIQDKKNGTMYSRTFNDRSAIPVNYTDKKIKPMALITMSGLEQQRGAVGANYIVTDSAGLCGDTCGDLSSTADSLYNAATNIPGVKGFVDAAKGVINMLPAGGLKDFFTIFSQPTGAAIYKVIYWKTVY